MDHNNKKDVLRGIVLFGVAVILAGCSWFSNKDDADKAKSLPPLEVPPDLIRPYSQDKVVEPVLPEKATVQTKDCQCDDKPPKIGEAVLPSGKGVQRLRDGRHRWLLVSVEPEQVWPLAKEFLERRGYQVSKNEPAVGLMETDWKNRFDNTNDQGISNSRERLRIRIEPGQQAGSSEIYLNQYSSERIASPGQPESVQWQLRESDKERSIEMLNRFARFLSGEKIEDVASLSPMKSRFDSDSDGGSVLVVEAEFEKVWRRTALALDALGFMIEDKDQTKGLYKVYNELPSGKTEEELQHGKPESATVREEYLLYLVREGGNTLISVRNETDQIDTSEVALHLLNLLHGQFQ